MYFTICFYFLWPLVELQPRVCCSVWLSVCRFVSADPLSMSPQKALETIGANLQKQYENWQPRVSEFMFSGPSLICCTVLLQHADTHAPNTICASYTRTLTKSCVLLSHMNCFPDFILVTYLCFHAVCHTHGFYQMKSSCISSNYPSQFSDSDCHC